MTCHHPNPVLIIKGGQGKPHAMGCPDCGKTWKGTQAMTTPNIQTERLASDRFRQLPLLPELLILSRRLDAVEANQREAQGWVAENGHTPEIRAGSSQRLARLNAVSQEISK